VLPDVLTGGAGREVSTGGKPGYDCSRFRFRSALPLRPCQTRRCLNASQARQLKSNGLAT